MAGAHTTPLRIGARGFSVREQLLLRSLVRIAGSQQPNTWEFVEDAPYHALFVSANTDPGPEANGAVCIPVQPPLKSERIAQLLDNLKAEFPRLAAGIAGTAAAVAAVSPMSMPPIGPPDDVAAVLQRLTCADADATPFAWLDGDQPFIIVHPAARTWCAPAMADAPMGTAQLRDVAARLVLGGLPRIDLSFDDVAREGALTHRLEPLLWHVGLLVSPDGVLPEVRRARWLRLARWPDFGTFGSDALQLKLSAFLVSRAYSIDELLLAANGAGDRVVPFLNACALCDLLVGDPADDRSLPRVSSAPRQFGPVMRMVRSALGMVQV